MFIVCLQSGTKLAPVSEAEVRAAFTARLGMPLTGQMLHGTLPFYPSLTVIEGEPTYIHKQIQQDLREQAPPPTAVGGNRQHPAAPVYHTAAPITDTQVAHARLHKAGHRPLGSMFPLCLRRSHYRVRVPCFNGQWSPLRKATPEESLDFSLFEASRGTINARKHSTRSSVTLLSRDVSSLTAHTVVSFSYIGRTQSAPLPLGHPMLQGGIIAPTTHYEEYLAEKQLHDQQQAHNYLKQQIRQTVLTRVGSRGQTNQLDEAPETEESEVIDLTGKKDHSEESEISKQQRDREQFLQQQRDLMMRHTLQTNESSIYAGSRISQSARPLSRALSSPLVHLGKISNLLELCLDGSEMH